MRRLPPGTVGSLIRCSSSVLNYVAERNDQQRISEAGTKCVRGCKRDFALAGRLRLVRQEASRRINRTAPWFAPRCGPIRRFQRAPSRPSVPRASPEVCRSDAPGSSKEPRPSSALLADSSSIPAHSRMSYPLSSHEPISHAFAKARSGELIDGKCRR